MEPPDAPWVELICDVPVWRSGRNDGGVACLDSVVPAVECKDAAPASTHHDYRLACTVGTYPSMGRRVREVPGIGYQEASRDGFFQCTADQRRWEHA
ncbi:hypothetical protein GCM10027415_26500 [Humibacter ginsengisoli]